MSVIESHIHQHFHRTPSFDLMTNRAWISPEGEIVVVDWHSELFDDEIQGYGDAFDAGWARVYGQPDGELGIEMRSKCSRQQFAIFRALVKDLAPSSLLVDAEAGNCKFINDPGEFMGTLGTLAF